MSRNTGTFNFAANFEVLAKAPLDAKQLVGVKADLTGATTWNSSGDIWLFDGAIVSVSSDPNPLNNGIYFLKDADNYDNINNWVKIGEGTGTITGGTNGLSTDGANIILGGNLLSGTTITIATGTSLIITDSRTSPEGIIYGGDYSATFTNNSLVTKGYVNSVASGLVPKSSVFVATTPSDGNLSLSGLSVTIDGQTIISGDRILVKNQTDPVENGIYIASSSLSGWTRAEDFDGSPQGEVAIGNLVPVESGTLNSGTVWTVLSTGSTIVVDTDPIYFTLFLEPKDYTGGVGIDITGSEISVDGTTLAGEHIEWDDIQFKFNVIPSGITSGYTTLSQFNTYSGDTEIRLTTIEDDIIYISGITDTKLDIDIFTGYTASTETRLTGIEDDIDYLSGVTENKLDTSVYTGYTATTEVRLTDIENDIDYISGQTLTISIFTGYTAITETRLTDIENDIQYISGITDNKLDTSIFAAYTGTTQPILNAALSGATNGLTATGRVVKLGSALTENTTINLSTFSLTFSDNPIEYAADYSADYNARSIPDVDFVTGYTQSAVTQSSNVLNIVDFTGTGYTATTESDFIGASGGTTIFLPNPPKDGQRIVVADIGGNALMSPIKIDGNGKEILKSTDQATINTEFGSITFIYNSKGFWSTAAFIN